MRNSSKGIIAALFLASAAAGVNGLAGQSGDYDPVTGEPDCTKCHTPDRRYSIDYTRDDTCAECHGPGLSESYLDINERYGSPHGAEEADKYARAAAKAEERKKSPAKGPSAAPEGMVLVPAGEFTMGSDDWWPKSQPEHKVRLDSFYIDRYEVTNKRFKRFVDATGRSHPDHWKDGRIPDGKEDHPVVYVSWADADAFCKWEGKRLPTEQEWEKAARGTDGRTFPWGDKFDRNKGNTPQYGNEDTLPVGSFEDGKSPYGVYDMAGNAFEWTDSWFKPHPGNTHEDENYGEIYKVLKGGSWYDCTYYKCGISAPVFNRIFFHTLTRNNNFGFRCAKDAR
ncbi:MAG: formylglycine-generating enzyme family protein [Thermodesulfobacteriota bacterium]|nr:MAG: formylglycine-generating enzyme family protein [Thermodesulfobacteriota bacterium]